MERVLSDLGLPIRFGLFIGNEFIEPSTGSYIERRAPFDRKVLLGNVAEAGRDDVSRAIEEAREAFDRNSGGWVTDYRLRSRVLRRAAELLEAEAERFAKLESVFVGKTIRTSTRSDIPRAVEMLEFYAGLAGKVHGHTQILRNGDLISVVREPIGVVAAIVPWNFPLLIAMRQVAPALAVGCTVVAKPATFTPATLLEMAELFRRAGMPKGVFNVVTGPGPSVGAELVRSPKVDAVAFTGETRTGRWIMENASGTLKRLVLELGGKNPNVVFEDADLEAAANGVVYGAFANNGESCAAGSRLLVQSSVKEKVLRLIEERVRRLRVGHPLDPSSDLGPLVSEQQEETVLGYINRGIEEGLRLVVGGQKLRGQGYDEGFYVAPTVFDGVPPDSALFREEIFGPVLTVTEFSDEEEAVELANATQYGLAAGVWSGDQSRLLRVAERIRAGVVWLNTYYTLPVEVPWGGYKQSGIGRNNSHLALEHYLETKCLYLDSRGERVKPYFRLVLGD